MTVLIVEDDLAIADMLQEALEAQGYTVTAIARTVKDAIHAVERQQPDFAVIDVHLAKGGLGTDVATYLRATTGTTIIFSTGNDDAGLTNLLGDAVMTKPYRLSDVARGIQILADMATFGRTELKFPRNFRLLELQSA